MSSVTCKYFLKGNCRFGDACYYSHDVPDYTYPSRPSTQYHNYKSTNSSRSIPTSDAHTDTHEFGNRGVEFMKAREYMNKMISDMTEHIYNGGMYPFTCYGNGGFNFPEMVDLSVEESRLEWYRVAETSNPVAIKKLEEKIGKVTESRVNLLQDIQQSSSTREFLKNLQSLIDENNEKERQRQKKTPQLFSTQNSEFGKPSTNQSSKADSTFGKASSGADAASLFKNAARTSNSSSAFGKPASSNARSVFGGVTTQSNKAGSAYDNSKSTSCSKATSLFSEAAKQSQTTNANNDAASLFARAALTKDDNSSSSFIGKSNEPSNKPTGSLFGKQVDLKQNTDASSSKQEKDKHNQAATAFGSTKTETGSLFGNSTISQSGSAFGRTTKESTIGDANSLFGKQVSSGEKSQSVFGGTSSGKTLFGKKVKSKYDGMDDVYYSKEEHLTDDILEAFSKKLVLGRIPTVPPPKSLCFPTRK